MQIRIAFKDQIRKPENRRKYVVPLTGAEANDFAAFKDRVTIKAKDGEKGRVPTEEWPCVYIINGLPKDKGKVTVFRFSSRLSGHTIMKHVKYWIDIGVSGGRPPASKRSHPDDAQLEYLPPYDMLSPR